MNSNEKKFGFGYETQRTNDWITPPWVIRAFDSLKDNKEMFFDLDPCISMTQPWKTAKFGYNKEQNGIVQKWFGMVFCNPPYGDETEIWIRLMSKYSKGVMLIFARVETIVWQEHIFKTADGFLFPRRRIFFYKPDGKLGPRNAGAPSAFVAWGEEAKTALITLCNNGKIEGAFFDRALCTLSERDHTKNMTMF